MTENNSELYLVEGVVESDPLTGHCTIRTEKEGKPFSFDPQTILPQFAGREVRLVLVSLATYQQIQEAAKQAEADGETVEVVDGFNGGN